ncbi:MAG: hypothetical protein CM15mP68_2130 [Pseudomonadota bacterium]|nr:MAG: hypothetical protein CM15mP68_2130 [Pseudomonadota bacterium]
MREPMFLSRTKVIRSRQNAMVVLIFALTTLPFGCASNVDNFGTQRLLVEQKAPRHKPPKAARRSRKYAISTLSAGRKYGGFALSCLSVSGTHRNGP